jgi:hypothetical protein
MKCGLDATRVRHEFGYLKPSNRTVDIVLARSLIFPNHRILLRKTLRNMMSDRLKSTRRSAVNKSGMNDYLPELPQVIRGPVQYHDGFDMCITSKAAWQPCCPACSAIASASAEKCTRRKLKRFSFRRTFFGGS